MSVKLLPRQRGCVLRCNGCDASLHTGQIQKGLVRVYAKTLGWGRGLRLRKRRDLCPVCMVGERMAYEQWKVEREKRKALLDEKRKAKFAAKGKAA